MDDRSRKMYPEGFVTTEEAKMLIEGYLNKIHTLASEAFRIQSADIFEDLDCCSKIVKKMEKYLERASSLVPFTVGHEEEE